MTGSRPKGVGFIDLVSDFDFHPDEPYVREFRLPRRDVLRMDGSTFVCESEMDGVVLRHYAFADEWFKVNVTCDRTGALVETPAMHGISPFALNCDIATPMLWARAAVHAVDLFIDVLVGADGLAHEVVDLDEFEAAIAAGLLSPAEAAGARSGLDRLVGIIARGELLDVLDDAWPLGPSTAGPSMPMRRVAVADVPLVQPRRRPTWAR